MTQLITAGSGLGGFTAIASQPGYGAAFIPPTRSLYFKSNKATHDPHFVQGGPYLAAGRVVDIGSAHVKTYIDAKGTLTGDFMSTSMALLLAASFGSGAKLKQAGTTSAYELGGATGIKPEAAESHNEKTLECETTSSSKSVKGIGTGSIAVGAEVTGAGVEAGTVVETIVSATELTLSKAIEAGKGSATAKLTFKESGFSFDMQIGIPYTSGEVVPYNYHSCVITKAEFVFDRKGLVTYSFDWDAQYVENTTALITPTFTTSGVPFSMGNTASTFEIGKPSAMSVLSGVRKITVTLEHKYAVDRIYLGKEYKEAPVSNGLIDIMVAAEVDYTASAKEIFAAFLGNEALELVAKAVGNTIGSSGKSNTLQFGVSNAFIETGGEPPLDGPDLVKNTMTLKGTINATNEAPLTAKLITADSTF